MEHLLAGFGVALSPWNLCVIVLGCTTGIFFGALPGISSAMGCVLLLPFVYGANPVSGLLLLTSAFCGATYGGSVTSILFNTPGTPEAVMTTLDGYPLHKQGRGGKALGTAISASVMGGLFSTIVMLLVAPPLAKIALSFGPAEYMALALLGLTAISGLSRNTVKALIACCVGLLLATFGADDIAGIERFTFDTELLLNGVHFIPVMIGAFAVAEVFEQIARRTNVQAFKMENIKIELMTLAEIWHQKWLLLRSAVLGVIIGILPGTGGSIASVLAYGEAVRTSRHPERFGTGVIEGVIAPETANNASTGGAMVPTLTLGIPGSGTTAVMLGAFIMLGLRPGPLLLREQPVLLYAIFVGMFIANILLFWGGFLFVRVFSQLSRFPYAIQAPIILMLCFVGSYALKNDIGDVWVMLAFGVIGFYLRRHGFSVAGLVLGLVLGDLAEEGLRKAMLLSQGEWLRIFLRPVAGPIFVLCVFALAYGVLQKTNWWAERMAARGKRSR